MAERRGRSSTPRAETWSAGEIGAGLSIPARYAAHLVVVVMAILLTEGVCMISSATISGSGTRYFLMQLVWIGLGMACCVAGAFLPLDRLYRKSHWILLATILPLAYLTCAALSVKLWGNDTLRFFPCAAAVKGAVRWLRMGSLQIQPSEFAKVSLVLFLAAYYGTLPRQKTKSLMAGVAVPVFSCGMLLAFIFLGKDLSTTVVAGTTLLLLMFLTGVRFRWLAVILALGLVVGTIGIAGSPMRRNRIVAWLHPEEGRSNESFQLFRSQVCLGIGGAKGLGYSQGYMKTYLPEPHTDFIVAVVGEEFGFLGLLAILAEYLLLCGGIVEVGTQCRRREDLLLCHGVAILVAVQAMVNIGVVSGWLPPTGVTAPFLSYGGSSVISLMFLVGLVLNVHRRNQAAVWRELGSQRCPSLSLERTGRTPIKPGGSNHENQP